MNKQQLIEKYLKMIDESDKDVLNPVVHGTRMGVLEYVIQDLKSLDEVNEGQIVEDKPKEEVEIKKKPRYSDGMVDVWDCKCGYVMIGDKTKLYFYCPGCGRRLKWLD